MFSGGTQDGIRNLRCDNPNGTMQPSHAVRPRASLAGLPRRFRISLIRFMARFEPFFGPDSARSHESAWGHRRRRLESRRSPRSSLLICFSRRSSTPIIRRSIGHSSQSGGNCFANLTLSVLRFAAIRSASRTWSRCANFHLFERAAGLQRLHVSLCGFLMLGRKSSAQIAHLRTLSGWACRQYHPRLDLPLCSSSLLPHVGQQWFSHIN
jgi:hypothetical protein